jgi:hypothetical protein
MKSFCALVCLAVVSLTALACGGNVVVDGAAQSSVSGEGAGPTACPDTGNDSDVMGIVGQPCGTAGATCESYDTGGCGYCGSVCSDGIWGPVDCEMIQDC